ncbi:MAG: serine/threonine protein kinase [Planctomycetes bacterium]|nr:serine/threonine protein kinase [Planctomycetota bacterium]
MTFAQPFPDYEILDRVGAGAMGTVFKARHKKLNRIVALKVLKPSLARDSRYVDRLRREARIVASLSHPNIVTGYDLGEQGGYHYFVMEFIEGKSLRAMLSEWGMFAEEYVRKVARQVAQALDHAWQRGVIHRDIKPGNILIDESGNVKLTDMGLAKGPADLTLTRDGATVGTPQYISPEQARNPHDVDVRTDLYSLGATLYHMATGVPPFRGDTMAELITNVLNELPVSPNAINSALSDGMGLVIRKLLAKDLTVRYQTPRDLLDDLDRLDRAMPPQIDVARLDGDGERVRWWPRVLLTLGLAALLGAAWWLGQSMVDPGERPPTASEFLAELDRELANLPTPGARQAMLRLQRVVPVGCERQLQERLRVADEDLRLAVGQVVDDLLGPGWAEFEHWLRDPVVWPDRARAEQERLQPALRRVAGLALGEVPPTLRAGRLDDLLATIDRTLAARDTDVAVMFDLWLKTQLPARAAERELARDFRGAEKVWNDGVASFCDGVRMPLQERLPEALRQLLDQRHQAAARSAATAIDAAEREVAAAMRAEVEAVVGDLLRRLQAGDAPDGLARVADRFRRGLVEAWPPANAFRVGRSPWTDVERHLSVLQVGVDAARARVEASRFGARCDLAWRLFAHGSAADAERLLAAAADPAGPHAAAAAQHGEALAAARAVERALLRAIADQPMVAFLARGGAEPIDVRAEPNGSAWQLTGSSLNQPARVVQLTELRLGDLLARLQRVRDPLASLPELQRRLGLATLQLVSEDLAGLGDLVVQLPAATSAFVVEEIAPRIQQGRSQEPLTAVDAATLLSRVREARESAGSRGGLEDLERALRAYTNVVAEAQRSHAETVEVGAIEAWLQLAKRRRSLLKDLAAAAPPDADVEVAILGDDIVGSVGLAGQALLRDAKDGWHLRAGGGVEFGGAGPWSELGNQVLEGNTGIEPGALRTSLVVDLQVPPASIGTRCYLFEFRGVAVVLAIAADDTVHAALVDDFSRREERPVREAFARAIGGVLSTRQVVAVPGAVHRLTIEVVSSTGRDRAAVRVLFEGAELFPPGKARGLNPQQPPTFAVHARQELVLHRVVVRAEGM